MNRRFLSSLLGVGVACLLGAGAALPETVLSAELKKSFSYFANGHELRTVLTGLNCPHFARQIFNRSGVQAC